MCSIDHMLFMKYKMKLNIPSVYQDFVFVSHRAMLGGPQSPTNGGDVSSTATEVENYEVSSFCLSPNNKQNFT
jgi:hypothetical protein